MVEVGGHGVFFGLILPCLRFRGYFTELCILHADLQRGIGTTLLYQTMKEILKPSWLSL